MTGSTQQNRNRRICEDQDRHHPRQHPPNRNGEQVATSVYDLASRRSDAEFELIDLRDYPLPHLDEPLPARFGQYQHEHTRAWADKIASSDGFVMVTPQYNHSTSGVLKNDPDHLHAEWNNKAVGFVSYGGIGGARAAEHLRLICGALQMADVPQQVALSLLTEFENSTIFKPGDHNATALDTLLDQVVAWSTALAPPRRFPGRRLNGRKPVPGVVKPLCDRWRTAGQCLKCQCGRRTSPATRGVLRPVIYTEDGTPPAARPVAMPPSATGQPGRSRDFTPQTDLSADDPAGATSYRLGRTAQPMEVAGMAGRGRQRWWALAALGLAVLAVGMDATVLSVALPTLATALHASESDLQWFSSGYLLVLAAAMLPAGLLGDRYGHKKLLLAALALFGAASAACAYAPSPGAFLAARAALGAAGASVIVMALSGLTVLFTEQERPKAVGVWAAANFLSAPIGPILGGWLLTHYWWGWVFLINLPVVLIGLLAVLALVPESRAPQRPGLDVVGVIASTAGLVGVTYGLIEAGRNGWTDAGAWAAMLTGLVLLVGFFVLERRLGTRPGGQPLLDLALFGSASYTWGVILVGTAVMAMIGALFMMPQYFQGVLGTDAMGSGLRLLPLIGGLMVGALSADRAARLVGAKGTVALGFALLAAGLLLGAATRVGSGGGFIAGWMAVVSAGMGLAMATATSAALVELSEQQSGVGSAVLQAVNKVGGPFGSAVLGSVLASAYQARLHLPALPDAAADAARASVFGAVAVARQLGSASLLTSARSAFVHGMDTALVVSAGIAIGGLMLATIFLPARATPHADQAAGAKEEADVAARS